MPRNTTRRSTADRKRKRKPSRTRLSIAADIRQIHATLARRLEMIHELQHTVAIQFQRIAQIQAELDDVKKACAKLGLTSGR